MDGLRMNFLRKDDLTLAIRERLHLDATEADAWAEAVVGVFGYERQIIDNVLDPEDRQRFYQLQETGLLTTRAEETLLHNGQAWRTHYWVAKLDQIDRAATTMRAVQNVVDHDLAAHQGIYDDLPDDAWERVGS